MSDELSPTSLRELWADLTDKQRAAVSAYIKTGNKIASYKSAYDIGEDTKRASVNRNCYNFFAKPKIRVIIEHFQAEALRKANLEFDEVLQAKQAGLVEAWGEAELLSIDAAWVLRRAALLADFNIRKFLRIDAHGNAIYDFSQATDDDWYCIQEYSVDEVARGQGDDKYYVDQFKVKGPDKIRALQIVGQHVQVNAFNKEDESDNDKALALVNAFQELAKNLPQ